MKLKLICAAFLSMAAAGGFSQEAAVKRGDRKYERYAYVDAVKTYERVAEKGYRSAEMLQKLGNSYYFNADLASAARWYGELFALAEGQDAEYFYRYSQSLKGIGEYGRADAMLEKFALKSASDARAALSAGQKDYLDRIRKNSGRYSIGNAGINSGYSDYGSAFLGEKLVFASARDTGGLAKRRHSWTGQPFTGMYVSDLNADGTLGAPVEFARRLDSRFHESTPAFSKDGKTMYFTRNNFAGGKKGKSAERITLLKIYRAALEGGKWTDAVALPFNSDQYSAAHPALSPDGKTLYFASDMPGTLGGSDLFRAAVNEDGSFGTPVNLGPKINTPGRETFPFVSDDGEIYFASDGHPGLGGLDVFAARIEGGGFSEIQNIGEPANTKQDDFAFVINSGTRAGFISSNREGGSGSDDIYKFAETRPLDYDCRQALAGVVTDEETGAVLADARVTLHDERFQALAQTASDASGNYIFGTAACGKTYYVRAERPEYATKELKVLIPEESGRTELPIALEKSVKRVRAGDDLARAFGIKVIYFDLDRWDIRQDAAADLAKIADVLKENPAMKIDVRSHTDSRQTKKYNERLSERRARSTVEWMVQNGIDPSRLTGKGYGEAQLLNRCADGAECSEEEHQLNRRSEFIITAL